MALDSPFSRFGYVLLKCESRIRTILPPFSASNVSEVCKSRFPNISLRQVKLYATYILRQVSRGFAGADLFVLLQVFSAAELGIACATPPQGQQAASVGVLLPNTSAKIIDSSGQVVTLIHSRKH